MIKQRLSALRCSASTYVTRVAFERFYTVVATAVTARGRPVSAEWGERQTRAAPEHPRLFTIRESRGLRRRRCPVVGTTGGLAFQRGRTVCRRSTNVGESGTPWQQVGRWPSQNGERTGGEPGTGAAGRRREWQLSGERWAPATRQHAAPRDSTCPRRGTGSAGPRKPTRAVARLPAASPIGK